MERQGDDGERECVCLVVTDQTVSSLSLCAFHPYVSARRSSPGPSAVHGLIGPTQPYSITCEGPVQR